MDGTFCIKIAATHTLIARAAICRIMKASGEVTPPSPLTSAITRVSGLQRRLPTAISSTIAAPVEVILSSIGHIQCRIQQTGHYNLEYAL